MSGYCIVVCNVIMPSATLKVMIVHLKLVSLPLDKLKSMVSEILRVQSLAFNVKFFICLMSGYFWKELRLRAVL